MTANKVLLGQGLRPLDAQHNVSVDLTQIGDAALSPELLDQSFQKELASINRFFEENQAGYENKRRQLRQNPTSIRIISDSGVGLLFTPTFGLEDRGRGAPVFRYVAPRTNDGIRQFKEPIRFVVMHSFGRGYDFALIRRNNTRTIAIDERTGHSPSRFALGVRTLVDPNTRNITNIHHVLSLRGDLVNSVSWDNRCVHGEGGAVGGINDSSIGIEHEEWYVRLLATTRQPREIEDHGPYSENQYAVDAFILKKLEAYTGYSYTTYLGHGEELSQNIKAKRPGCFNHASSSRHADPGAEFFLPPGFTLGSDINTAPMAKDRPGAWERRFAIWYPDLPRNTKISAYDRIFDKVERLRSFDLQTEVFDPSINGGRIQIQIPEVQGQYAVAAAQRTAQDRLASMDRAQRMQGQSRVDTYLAAQKTNTAVTETWARQTASLVRISSASAVLPTIENALGFDKTTGTWVNVTSVNSTVTNTSLKPATPTTVNINTDGKEV